MICKLYTAYDLPFDHDTCHLFEHVVNRRFLKQLQKTGHHRGLFGRLNGQTVDSSVFFDLGVYNADIIALFESNLKQLSDSNDISLLVDECLLHIGAETRCSITVKNRDRLIQHIKQLAYCFISQKSKPSKTSTEETFSMFYNPQDFAELEVDIVTELPNEQLMRAWCAMRLPICDIVHNCALDPLPLYLNEASGAWTEDGRAITSVYYTISKDADTTRLENLITESLRLFQAGGCADDIQQYQHEFQTDDWFVNSPIILYELFGLKATRKEIADTITPDLLGELLLNTHIHTTVSS